MRSAAGVIPAPAMRRCRRERPTVEFSMTRASGGAPSSRDEPRALASSCALLWIVVVAVLANAAAVSPPGDRLSALNAWMHTGQHAVIFGASLIVGAGLRDLARAHPWPTGLRLAVGASGVAFAATTLLPPLHSIRHGVFAFGGALLGVALRDALLARGRASSAPSAGARASRLKPYAPDVYTPEVLRHWIATGRRQEAKDQVLLVRIARSFVPGRVLDLGAGAGQTSLLLRGLGRDVVASDYAPFFVDHLRSLGLEAHRVDATDISASRLGLFPNIFCQSITPLITSDLSVVARAYRSIHESLEPGGQLVEIHAQAARHELRATMREHANQARRAGFEDVRVVRNQLLPSSAYRAHLRPLAAVAERALGPSLGSRFVLTARRPLERPAAPGATSARRGMLRFARHQPLPAARVLSRPWMSLYPE